MSTIVTGFIDLYEYDPTERETWKTVDLYFERAAQLLKTPYNKVVFLQKKFEDRIQPFLNEHTKIVFFEKEEMPLWQYRDRILKASLPRERLETKDTHDFMMIMANKTYWVKKAIELNPFGTDNFVWVDMGICYIVKDGNFEKYVGNLVSKTYDRVRIPGCWDLFHTNGHFPFPIHEKICWFFLGGVFGGHKNALIEFHDKSLGAFIELISHNICTWETNIWFLVWDKFPHLFSWYKADHNPSMFVNY